MFGKTFSTNSFIYRFLAWPNGFISSRNLPETICELRGRVLGKLAILAFLITLGFVYVSSVASYLLYFFTCKLPSATSCMYGLSNYAKLGGFILCVTAAMAGIIGLVIGLAKLTDMFYNWKYNRRSQGKKFISDDNPVKLIFNSAVDKVCYPVEFTEATK